MTKREKKLNNIWFEVIKKPDSRNKEILSIMKFFYSISRISYEEALIQVSLAYLDFNLEDEKVKKLIEIMEGKQK